MLIDNSDAWYLSLSLSLSTFDSVLRPIPYPTGAPLQKHFWHFLAAGFCFFLNQALFIVGVDISGVVVASCIQPSQPIVTLAIAVLVGQERLDTNKCVGLGFAVFGAVWVVAGDMLMTGKSAAEAGKNSVVGDLCLIANCVAMGLCYVLVKQLNKMYSPLVVIAWIYAYAAVFLVFIALFFHPVGAEVSPGRPWLHVCLCLPFTDPNLGFTSLLAAFMCATVAPAEAGDPGVPLSCPRRQRHGIHHHQLEQQTPGQLPDQVCSALSSLSLSLSLWMRHSLVLSSELLTSRN